ncbi:hypothetical protein FQN57_001140 [Myotisia sp. PD_48]|nr:hypothetical protein FQN57_001140 [Myotisia sp. PD_48]
MAPAAVVGKNAKKRPAEEALEGERRRLERKFDRLQLDGPSIRDEHAGSVSAEGTPQPLNGDDNGMQVDDTKTRVYITNLNAEIAEIEKEEATRHAVDLMPDVEKRMMAIPKSVLSHKSADSERRNNEMVLYRPFSFTVYPKEENAAKEKDTAKGVVDETVFKSSPASPSSLPRMVIDKNYADVWGTDTAQLSPDGYDDAMEID